MHQINKWTEQWVYHREMLHAKFRWNKSSAYIGLVVGMVIPMTIYTITKAELVRCDGGDARFASLLWPASRAVRTSLEPRLLSLLTS